MNKTSFLKIAHSLYTSSKVRTIATNKRVILEQNQIPWLQSCHGFMSMLYGCFLDWMASRSSRDKAYGPNDSS